LLRWMQCVCVCVCAGLPCCAARAQDPVFRKARPARGMDWEGTAWRLAALGQCGIGRALKRDWRLGRDWLPALDGLRIQGSSDGRPRPTRLYCCY